MDREEYEREKYQLQVELLKFQYWTIDTGAKHVLVFEGRDAAGKGGTIKRFMEHLNPGRPGSSRSPNPPRPSWVSGTSSATSSTCQPPGRSCCSTGPGTTGPGSSA
jgi:Polyphosphate kinase 2 (PPK2)